MSRELLIEKMARAMLAAERCTAISDGYWEILWNDPTSMTAFRLKSQARAILSLLSDPANITPEMVVRFSEAFDDPKLPGETTHEQAIIIGIAAAFSERAP